ncbi:MAG: hypothetical protein ACLQNE_42690 [Thermoguttaceae bacterium]
MADDAKQVRRRKKVQHYHQPDHAHFRIEYLHDNPVRRGLARRAEDWPWSSAADWAGTAAVIIKVDRFPGVAMNSTTVFPGAASVSALLVPSGTRFQTLPSRAGAPARRRSWLSWP